MAPGSYPDQIQEAEPQVEPLGPQITFGPPPSPKTRLSRMIAEAHVKASEEDRQTDSKVMPAIAEDMAKSIEHTRQMQADFEALRNQLEAMHAPQMQQTGLETGDMIGAGLSGLFGGAQGLNQALGRAYERNDAQDVQRFREEQQQFGMQRENARSHVDELETSLNEERSNLRKLRQMQIQALMSEDEGVRTAAENRIKHLQSLEQLAKEDEGRLTLEREKQVGREKLQTSKDRVAMFRAMIQKASPEGRGQLAREWSEDPGFIKAMSEENADEILKGERAETEDKMRDPKINAQKALTSSRLAGVKLTDARRAKVVKETEDMDDELAIKYARAGAYLDDVNDRIRARGVAEALAEAKNDVANAKAILAAIQSGANAKQKQIEGYRSKKENAASELELIREKHKGDRAKFEADPEYKTILSNHKALEARESAARDEKAVFDKEAKQAREMLEKAVNGPGWLDKAGNAIRGFIGMGGTKKSNPYAPAGVEMPGGKPDSNLTPEQKVQAEAAKVKEAQKPSKKERAKAREAAAKKEAEMKAKGWKT